ncbi:proline racemase family protein [Agromyces archimandritae]|uniref:Proline racemase family protein n=1 Tax=Agromyces archimandritae TaxID=2781962 RepID=A0A975FLD1_9MICO|nr:proline racemase family protein [Agromyces archimandritae]QTX03568.1 proline racemase family protein [Agromyces archimandritae]
MDVEAVRTEDYHTGGEPFRIVAEPPVPLPGATVAERRQAAIADAAAQRLRRILCFEPRGHADMYGGFITPPDDAGAHFGVLFWHKDGFSTACGHGTIALGAWAVETGRVPADPSGVTEVVIDVPSGRVTARVHHEGRLVTAVDFVNVPSYVIATDVPVETSRGPLLVDIAYGGAIYAQLDAATAGLAIEPARADEIIALGREMKLALNDSEHARHSGDERLSGVYGTILFERSGAESADASGADAPAHGDVSGADAGARGTGADGAPARGAGEPTASRRLRQRNATVFADGELDRSPCGSGTCARIATLAHRGELGDGDVLEHGSIVGSEFTARIAARTRIHSRDAVVPVVTGMAYRTGTSEFTVDPRDPLTPGFVLR